MTKQELDKLIEAAEYCTKSHHHCSRCKYFNTELCLNYSRIAELILPVLKDYRQIKFGEIKTDDEQLVYCADCVGCECKYLNQQPTNCKSFIPRDKEPKMPDEFFRTTPIVPQLEKELSTNSQVTVKEEVDTTKELSTEEVMHLLKENQSLRFKCLEDMILLEDDTPNVELNSSGFVWEDTNRPVNLYYHIDSKWQLIPPEPVEVECTPDEAVKAWLEGKKIKEVSKYGEGIKNNEAGGISIIKGAKYFILDEHQYGNAK